MNNKKFISFFIIIVLLCQIIILTSCANTQVKQEDKTPVAYNNEGLDNKETSPVWKSEMSSYDVNIPYVLPEFTPQVKNYDINKDLSNLFNAGQYTGFTEEQKNSIYEDRFVVLKPSYSDLQMHHIYEFPMYKKSPMFISVDSALHLYHIFYDNSLKYIELSSMYEKLDKLSQNMLKKSIEYYNDPQYENLKEELKFVSAYFMTACRLMEINIDEHNIPSEISSMVDKEIILIDDASDFKESPILKKDLDYSQFVVRGHYAGNDNLIRYFKTMMWYGQCGFPVFMDKEAEPTLDMDNMVKSMIITSLALSDEETFKNYENIYSTTAIYTGLSDDLGIFEYRDLIKKVYGSNPDINIFKDTSYNDKLLEQALLLPEPKIQAKYSMVTTPVGKQFRFMGQRYSFDAETMQNLIEPQLRPVPSGLDVISAFDNKRAEEILDIYYEPKINWSKYTENLEIMRNKEKFITDDEWKSDLYNGWLWSLKSSSVSFEDVDGMPQFMRNQKWTDKNIHTALGSYAELKHDSILYKKQSGAEMGGGGGEMTIPYNYVEPNVEVYAKLTWLAKNTKENLSIRNMLDERSTKVLDSIIEMQETLMNVSVKELTNQAITEEENIKLFQYGGRIDYVMRSLNYMLMDAGIKDDDNYTSALIADVSTVAPDAYVPSGHYLELGNGLPCEIYVVCNTNGKTYLAKGALFNYYEFLSDKRMTDEEWYNLIGIKKVIHYQDETKNEFVTQDLYDENGNKTVGDDVEYFESVEITEPSPRVPSKPEWTKSFISEQENKVTINEDLELDWAN